VLLPVLMLLASCTAGEGVDPLLLLPLDAVPLLLLLLLAMLFAICTAGGGTSPLEPADLELLRLLDLPPSVDSPTGQPKHQMACERFLSLTAETMQPGLTCE
jgi:hypothetical protein